MSVVQEDLGPFSPSNVYGPTVAGGFVQAILQGLLLSQTWTFFEESGDVALVNCIVIFANIVSLIQTCFNGYNWWNIFVLNYGKMSALISFSWPAKIQAILTCLMSAPVHGYFIYRCWKSTNGNRPICVLLGALALATIITSIMASAKTFGISIPPSTSAGRRDTKWPIRAALVAWLVSSAVLDILITAILLIYLIHSRRKSHSRYVTQLINQLILILWESAAPPCVCAIAMFLTYIIPTLEGTVSFWPNLCQDLLGKLYCLSLMVTLNSRVAIRRRLDSKEITYQPTMPVMKFDIQQSGVEGREGDGNGLGTDSPASLTFRDHQARGPTITVLGRANRILDA